MVKSNGLTLDNQPVSGRDVVTALDIKRVKNNLRRRFERVTLNKIASDYPKVKRATLHRFITSDYIPQDVEILKALGVRVLPKLAMDLLRIIRGGV